MSDTPAVRVYQPPKTITEAYTRLATTVAPLLPDGMDPKQFVGLVGSCLAKTPKLKTCEPESFVLAVREAAELGLWPGTNAAALAYLVPKAGKCQFRIGYRGLEELAYRKGWILTGAVVNKGDVFRWQRGTNPEIIHKPRRSQPATGAELVYAYAVCSTSRRTIVDFEILDREEIEKRRQAGDAPNETWWTKFYPRMASKSAVRALAMRLPLAPSGQTLTQRGVGVELEEAETGSEPMTLTMPPASAEPDDDGQDGQAQQDQREPDGTEQGRLV